MVKHSTDGIKPNSATPSSSSDSVISSLSVGCIVDTLHEFRCRVLKRIPKASRTPAANKLADILNSITRDPDNNDNWRHLLLFPFTCVWIPRCQRGSRRHKGAWPHTSIKQSENFSLLHNVQPHNLIIIRRRLCLGRQRVTWPHVCQASWSKAMSKVRSSWRLVIWLTRHWMNPLQRFFATNIQLVQLFLCHHRRHLSPCVWHLAATTYNRWSGYFVPGQLME